MCILVGSWFTVGAVADAKPLQVEGENRGCGKDLEALGSVCFGLATVLVSRLLISKRERTYFSQ